MTISQRQPAERAPKKRPLEGQGQEQAKGQEAENHIRQIIMKATVEVVAKKGVLATTLREVSLLAKISTATLCYHFGNRQTLIKESLKYLVVPVIDKLWESVFEFEDPLETLMEMQKRLFDIATTDPWFLAIWCRELACEDSVLRPILGQRVRLTYCERFIGQIRAAQANGSLNPNLKPELVFMSLVGLTYVPILGKDVWERMCGRQISHEETLAHIRALLIDGLIAPKKEE
jgi:AcrR family transcriptional regulator